MASKKESLKEDNVYNCGNILIYENNVDSNAEDNVDSNAHISPST
jgi:hypothetical protein